ncbi:hypothetical protein P691DRAFT_204060 [Macrolepiota fuliginosa MF-IS2]|uniref:Uncharacterized protein n=1 Tax=Macrolepiota fuliginosa MF-IS2 TaxID=1400762 RepID=A0A9P6CB83_9AGAR|nr:hypothetical protein P691DRAFT_204060 [Macrolepiota fuliginosa MF-IS2]
MAASLVQQECVCTCQCTGHVHNHDHVAGHGATLGLGFPFVGLPSGHHHGGGGGAGIYGSNQYNSATSTTSSEHHSFSASTAISSSTNISVGASANAHGTVEIVEPRVYPFKGGHVKHTHASYRRDSIPELNPHTNTGAVVPLNGHAHGNGVAHHDKLPAAPAKAVNSWTLCVPIPIPLGLANATLESLVYTIRYASLNAGSASVQTDIVLSHGAKVAEGIVTDYTRLALYAHHGVALDEKSGRGKGYGPPMLNEALGLALASVPAFKNAGSAGAWSHYLDHQKIHPNVRLGDNSSYAAHAHGGLHDACHAYLFFHVYEYPGADVLRSISIDVSATWNDGEELRKIKEERARELNEFRMERERLVIMKREVELTIKRLEESVKRANEESEKRIKGEEAMEKELGKREEEFLAIEMKAKEAYELRMKEEEERLKELDEAELKAKRLHERRLHEEEERFKALSEAELKAKAEHERRVKEEVDRLKEISEVELRAKTEYEKRTLEEETRLKVLEETQKRFKEEAERIAREETQRHAREEVEWKAHEEAERKAREDAERWSKQQAEVRAKEEAEHKARLEAERTVREEAERKAKEEEERIIKLEAERKAREEAERKAKEAAAVRPVPKISEAPHVADEHMQEHIAKVADKLGQKCKNGYAWEKKAHGYKCSGGGHFISFKDLGMQ